MRSKSILLKSIICASVYPIFLPLIIFVVYILRRYEGAFFIGLPCGAVIALVTWCDKLKRTAIARIMGLISIVAAYIILEMLHVPYSILDMYMPRDDMGNPTVIIEMISYGWGPDSFWAGLVFSFVVTGIGIFIFSRIKSRRKLFSE